MPLEQTVGETERVMSEACDGNQGLDATLQA